MINNYYTDSEKPYKNKQAKIPYTMNNSEKTVIFTSVMKYFPHKGTVRTRSKKTIDNKTQ